MGRPPIGKAKKIKVSVMLDPDVFQRITDLHARLQARTPLGTLTSTTVYREIIARGLAQMEAETAPKRATRKGATEGAPDVA
jgi:hypothetical protein